MLRNLDWLHDLDVQYDASRSTRTHLSRSQTDVTLCFRSGCHAQMTIALLLYNQCVTALQEVTLTSLHSPAGFHMAETFSIAYETLPAEA